MTFRRVLTVLILAAVTAVASAAPPTARPNRAEVEVPVDSAGSTIAVRKGDTIALTFTMPAGGNSGFKFQSNPKGVVERTAFQNVRRTVNGMPVVGSGDVLVELKARKQGQTKLTVTVLGGGPVPDDRIHTFDITVR